jgi:DNA primase
MKPRHYTRASRIETVRARLGTPADVLRRHGHAVRGSKALCPFHDDRRTPNLSLFVGRDGKHRWHCFVCGFGGDAVDLEARLSGRSVSELCR